MQALLVEYSPSDVSPLESALQSSFARPVRAGTLEQCLQALKTNTFDVILLDLHLPDSQGLDTLAAVHRQSPGTPIVVLSQTGEQQAGVDALRLGAQDFLCKDRIEPGPLERAIRNAVERLRQKAHLDAQRQTREVQSVARVSRHAGTTVTSQIYGGLDLRERDPERFLEFQERYFKLMDTAVEAPTASSIRPL